MSGVYDYEDKTNTLNNVGIAVNYLSSFSLEAFDVPDDIFQKYVLEITDVVEKIINETYARDCASKVANQINNIIKNTEDQEILNRKIFRKISSIALRQISQPID
jgi:rRNA-processing protein FCF1